MDKITLVIVTKNFHYIGDNKMLKFMERLIGSIFFPLQSLKDSMLGKLVLTILRFIVSFIALMSLKIDSYWTIKESAFIKSKIILLNLLFVSIFSIWISLFLSIILSLLNYNFKEEFISYLSIFFTIFVLMILTNAFELKINIPKLLLQIFFYFKSNISDIVSIVLFFIFFGFVFLFSTFFLAFNFYKLIIRYGFGNDLFSISISIILAVGLVVAGFYSFPVSKSRREINELILSPVIIIISIAMGYYLNENNILSQLEEGNENLSMLILGLFIIAASVQVSNYFKKVMEKVYGINKYEQEINVHAAMFKEYFRTTRKWISKSAERMRVDFEIQVSDLSRENARLAKLIRVFFYIFYGLLLILMIVYAVIMVTAIISMLFL